MSDAAPAAPASATPIKKAKASKPKGEKKPKAAPSHPVYGAMIKAAIKELKDRKGASKQAILKYVMQKYKLGDNEKQVSARLRMALKKGVIAGSLKQASGTGAAGRFRLPDKAEGPATPKAAKKPKAAGATKPKKAAAKPKKAAGTPKKAKATKKPKSPKKAAAKTKSAKSPKKPAAKKATKPKTAKKPAAKKAAPKA